MLPELSHWTPRGLHLGPRPGIVWVMDHAPRPFTTATPSACKRAWTGGVGLPPLWERYRGIEAVDTAGFHALLRAAGLPEAELRHMGVRPHELAFSDVTYLERAEEVLGRIAWDAEYGAAGRRFGDSPFDAGLAVILGRAVVRAWFS